MKKALTMSLIIAIVIGNSGCPKPCVETNYSFIVHSQITPDIDSFNIGDTIYLVSSFPSTLQDQNSAAQINYSASKPIGSTLEVVQLIPSDSISRDAVPGFNYFAITGKIYNDRNIADPDGVQQLVYQEVGADYQLKVGLIPKISGVYALVVGNGISAGKNDKRGCTNASFNITFENTEQHLYLLYDWKSNAQFYGDGKSRVYYFKVK